MTTEIKQAREDDCRCAICGVQTDSIGGAPSQWPVCLLYGHGDRKVYHMGCAGRVLHALEKLEAVDTVALGEAIDAHKEAYERDIKRVEEGNKNFVGMNKDRPKKSPSSVVIEAAATLKSLVEELRGME